MDTLLEENCAPGSEEGNSEVMKAGIIYILMKSDYRISRGVRTQWFLDHINKTLTIPPPEQLNNCKCDLTVISIIPQDCLDWNPSSSHTYTYLVTPSTNVVFLSHMYSMVYCLDMSPSLSAVDIQHGQVMVDDVFLSLKRSLDGITKPFVIPGSSHVFQPEVYVTVIAHTPFFTTPAQQVLMQGYQVTRHNLEEFLSSVRHQLELLEDTVAQVAGLAHDQLEVIRAEWEKLVGGLFEEKEAGGRSPSLPHVPMVTPDAAFINMLRYGMLALRLLPESSSPCMIVITDGIICGPDVHIFDSVLTQLRTSTIACSFFHVGSLFHPHCCQGLVPYVDLMQFIAHATGGVYMIGMPNTELCSSLEMNAYHSKLLIWSFKKGSLSMGAGTDSWVMPARGGDWHVSNTCFYGSREPTLLRKKQLAGNLLTSLISVVCCRLKEGYAIKSAKLQDNQMELCLVLPWKDHIYLEYVTTVPQSHLAGQTTPVSFTVSIQAPYEFLHDITCKLKKPFQSQYRQAVVTRFWATLNNLSQSDQLLVHLNTFPTNPTCYTVPESIRSGMPLFYLPANSSVPVLSSTDLTCPQFAQFWRPICQLDHTVWHKWLHSHRLGLLLLHDHPLPRHLHLANPSGRFQVVQCRQAAAALTALLKDMSTFVLIENQSYVKFVPSDELEKPPKWFYIMRASSKPPYVMINVAFLGGTPSEFRNKVIQHLKQQIEQLSFPQRPKLNKKGVRVRLELEEPDVTSPISTAAVPSSLRSNCCILLKKPVEKILVRYERMPSDFGTVVFPDGTQPVVTPDTGSSSYGGGLLTTLSRYLHHRRWIWAAQNGSQSSLGVTSVARILSIITKMRLQEGFHFAHSTAGIINMVLEVDMKGTVTSPDCEEVAPLQPCVIQYVLFPPHSSISTSKGSASDDEITEEVEVDSMTELQIIAECWIEPQHGFVVNSPPERLYMENLPYFKLPDVISRVDAECISSLLTFEQLSLMCRMPQVPAPLHLGVHLSVTENLYDYYSTRPVCALNVASLPEQRIHHMPFPFNLLSILPNCHQADQMYAMLIQDLGPNVNASSGSAQEGADGPNYVLCDMLLEQLKSYHDRELHLGPSESLSFLRLVEEHGPDVPSQQEAFAPRWRCFIRCITPIRLVLTFVPASYADLKLLVMAGSTEDRVQVSSNAEPSKAHSTSEAPWSMDEKLTLKLATLPKRETVDAPFRVRASTWDTTQLRSQPLSRIRTYSMDSKVQAPRPQMLFNADGFKWKHDDVLDSAQTTPMEQPTNQQQSNTECSDKGSHIESPIQWSSVQLGALSMPVYMYDCPLNLLINRLVQKESNKVSLQDINGDQTNIHHGLGESHESTMSKADKTEETEQNKQLSPEPKSDDSENVKEEPCLKEHCRLISQAYSKCFVVALFMSLHQGKAIAAEDVQTAVDECEEALIEVDITRYIKTVCGHLKEFRLKKMLEEMKLAEGVLSPDGQVFPLSQLTLCGPCRDLKLLHTHIKNKFTQIITLAFKPIPSHPELFFCSPDWEKLRRASHTQACELYVERLGRERNASDVIDEDIEFYSEHGSLSTIDDLQKSLISEDEVEGSSASDFGEDLMTQQLQLQPAQGLACPLFLHLTCSIRSEGKINSCSVRDLPTCLAELLPALDCSHVDLSNFQVTLDILCLTLPTDLPEKELKPLAESSPGSPEEDNELASSLSSPLDTDLLAEPAVDNLQHLPAYQHKAVATSVEEIQWLLRDEMAALFLDEFPLQEQTLHFVADHVASSPNRPSCIMEQVPLHFVFGPEKSLKLFLQEFYSLNVCGYHIMKEGDLNYLVMDTKSKAFSYLAPKLRSSRYVPKADDGTVVGVRISPEHLRLMQVYLDTDSDEELFKKRSIFKPIPRGSKKNLWQAEAEVKASLENNVCAQQNISTPLEQIPTPTGFSLDPATLPSELLTDLQNNGQIWNDGQSLVEQTDAAISDTSNMKPSSNNTSEFQGSPEVNSKSAQTSTLGAQGQTSTPIKEDIVCLSSDQFFTPINRLPQEESISSPENFFVPVDSPKHEIGVSPVDRVCDSKQNLEEPLRELSPAVNSFMKQSIGSLNLEGSSTPGTRSGNSSRVGTEDGTGYEGDSSDSGEDSDWIGDLESKQPSLPNFWLVMKVDNDAVTTYFHHRVLEGSQEEALYRDIQQNVVAAIKNLSKLVNQTLLLQNLHNTRMCDQLLEPQASEDIWKPPPLARGKSLEDGNEENSQSCYLEATMKFMPGWFACSVVWETHLGLHPRLKSGPGFSRGMQALRAVLNRFSVNNRTNMFVYQDTGGNVFYLRLHENVRKTILSGPSDTEDPQSPVPVSRSSSIASLSTRNPPSYDPPSGDARPRVRSFGEKDSPSPRPEDSVVLKVHGISPAGNEIKQELVQVLQNRLDDAVLEVLLIMLERNPMCKLTPDDVHFIQKPLRPPESVIRFSIQPHALAYLPALDFYIRQNLMQFLHTPKYTDARPDCHFQDYSEPESSRVTETDLYLYNQTLSSGSKGIACLALALVDSSGSLISNTTTPKFPSEMLVELSADQFDNLTWSDVCWGSGDDLRLEFRIWKQGRVNLESLTQRLRNAVRHAHWDLLMEYQILTAPLPDSSNPDLPMVFQETLQLWLNFAVHLSVPSVKRQGVTLNRRHSLSPMLKEILSLITLNASDTNLWVFSSSKQGIIPWSTTDVFPNSEAGIVCMIMGRNLKQWQACVMDRSCYDPDILNPKAQKGFQKFPPYFESGDADGDGQSKRLVPRQRFLLATLTNSQMLLYTYNWSKERVENLHKQVANLGQWLSARAVLLNNIITQKMGLFHSHPHKPNMDMHGVQWISDVEQLMKFVPGALKERKIFPCSPDLFRDYKLVPHSSRPGLDPVIAQAQQVLDMKHHLSDKEDQKKLYIMWQTRGATPNIPLAEDILMLFRQHARTIHYCMTPLLFLPSWRLRSAATRDHTLSNQTLPPNPRSPTEKWHFVLCTHFVTEYKQYLQTLGFIPIQTEPGAAFSQRASEDSTQWCIVPGNNVCYLQKSLLGGILLLELVMCEPFFHAKLHALECSRLQGRSSSSHLMSQFTLSFVDECDRMKVLLHLHSFTYDYHLRSAHAYLAGKSVTLNQGYHLIHFLEDFLKYYNKAPNFARNLVFSDTVIISEVSTPARQLYNYLLSHEKMYNMEAFRMVPATSNAENPADNEYALVHVSQTIPVTYRDAQDTKQTDDFDVTLIVWHEGATDDDHMLALHYYILLTSRRELYPKLDMERKLGKFRKVSSADTEENGQVPPTAPVEIRRESVNYLGYYSSHEQLMQTIMCEQASEAIRRIRSMVELGSVHCRTHLLWTKLQCGGLSYSEFDELRELSLTESISRLDTRLAPLLCQSIQWYQGLVRVLQTRYTEHHRIFQSADGNETHVVILHPRYLDAFMLLSVDVQSSRGELSAIYRKHMEGGSNAQQLEFSRGDIHSLIEGFVNTCCFHLWAGLF